MDLLSSHGLETVSLMPGCKYFIVFLRLWCGKDADISDIFGPFGRIDRKA